MNVLLGFELFLSTCLLLLGISGNFLVLLGAHKEKSLRKVPYMFVINLSVCHLIVLFFPFPLFVVSMAAGKWVFSDVVCDCQAYMGYTLGTEVMATMVLLSVNRYFRIVQPSKYHFVFSGRSTKCLIVCSWCFSFLVNIFPLIGYGNYGFNHINDFMCALIVSSSVHQIIIGKVFIIVCVCIIIACYIKVFYAIRTHRIQTLNVSRQSSSSDQPREQCDQMQRVNRTGEVRSEEVQIVITLFALVVLFGICWSPTVVSAAINGVTGEPTPHIAGVIRVHALVLETVLDPVIYAIRNRKFRQVKKRICRKQ